MPLRFIGHGSICERLNKNVLQANQLLNVIQVKQSLNVLQVKQLLNALQVSQLLIVIQIKYLLAIIVEWISIRCSEMNCVRYQRVHIWRLYSFSECITSYCLQFHRTLDGARSGQAKTNVDPKKNRHLPVCMDIEQRAIIKYLRFKNYKTKYITNELHGMYGQQAHKLWLVQH
jgi:hypothetical protein